MKPKYLQKSLNSLFTNLQAFQLFYQISESIKHSEQIPQSNTNLLAANMKFETPLIYKLVSTCGADYSTNMLLNQFYFIIVLEVLKLINSYEYFNDIFVIICRVEKDCLCTIEISH